MKQTGLNMGLVKTRNRSLILNYINANGAVSRKDIAAATGLTPAAVTIISQELIAEGILMEVGPDEAGGGAGRRKMLVDIDYDSRYLFSVNIEKESTTIVVCNLKGNMKSKKVVADTADFTGEAAGKKSAGKKAAGKTSGLRIIAEKCRQLRSEMPDDEAGRIAAVSVGITGIVDTEKGSSVHAYDIWEDEVDVCGELSELLELPCYIENNVNALAKAIVLYGEGRRYENLLIVKWGPGVGSAIIIDNELYEGRHGKAAELGHVIVDRDGIKCSCGRRGCLETRISANAIREMLEADKKPASGSRAKTELDEALDIFARTVVNSATVLAPNRIVLCGYLFRDQERRSCFIEHAKAYDGAFDENRILYNSLSECEDYIGPVASYVKQYVFG